MTSLAGLAIAAIAAASGIGALRAAVERGDLDEVARRGELAGPAVVADAIASPDRLAQLGGVIAAPAVEDAPSLLPALASSSGGADRRTAIPAARAASRIAAAVARADRDDDVADDDLAAWHDAYLALAMRGDRWIEVRVAALETAAELAHARLDDDAAATTVELEAAIGFPLAPVLADPDPAFRRAALVRLPQPLPAAARAPLAAALANDPDPAVAIAAAQATCADLVADDPQPVLAALAGPPLARLRSLLAAPHLADLALGDGTLRDAARCLAADASPASTAALASLAQHASPALRRALAAPPRR